MKSYTLTALHGFLGRPSDWDCFNFDCLQALDLYTFYEWIHLWDWADQLNAQMSASQKNILLGYSLGGRLALHALIRNPLLWQAGIIISAHPGLSRWVDKENRLKIDQEWANRFSVEEWNHLMKAWNSREVFSQNDFTFTRFESHYQRQQLAYILQKASLGKQDDLRAKIKQLPIPILWVVGENDLMYSALAQSITFSHPQSKLVVISKAGHRTPWERSLEFKDCVNQFLNLCLS